MFQVLSEDHLDRNIHLHVPVTRQGIADSTHRLTHWGTPGVIIRTDESISGFGYTGAHAHLPTDRLITQFIGESYAPRLIGSDPLEVRSLWGKLLHHAPLQWVGRAGISHLALSAVDIALWDLKAKAAQMPLWKLLGGSGEKKVRAYNTDGGRLNWSITLADVRGQHGHKRGRGHGLDTSVRPGKHKLQRPAVQSIPRGRVIRHIKMQDLAAAMSEHDKNVQHFERNRRYRKEVN